MRFSCLTPTEMNRLAQAIAAAPAPLKTHLTYDVLTGQLEGINERGCRMIAVHADRHERRESSFDSLLFNVKTLWRLDIFKIYRQMSARELRRPQ